MNDQVRIANLPNRIRGLERLAYNLWWTWHPPARELFRSLDLRAWRKSQRNPILLLNLLSAEKLASVAEDRHFLARYDSVLDQFDAQIATPDGWFTSEYGRAASPLAYFSFEFGLHASLPVYAGGLGILAGDHLKEASDLAVPAVGIGLIYSRGYAIQRIREDGWPDDVEEVLDRTYDPITQVLNPDGTPLIVQVPLFDPPVHVSVWKVAVGRVPLYLLDTDLPINEPWDRAIAQHLYASDVEQRLRQEIVLGVGGMQVLGALGIQPGAIHLNEGHPSLAIFDRVQQLTRTGVSFDDAVERVRSSTIFTTHTPLAAGTDVFPFPLMDKYFTRAWEEANIDRGAFLQLGVNPADPGAGFNMTVYALRSADFRNAVSKRHGQVARRLWAGLWPDKPIDQVPIASITNGIHLPSWINAMRMQPLFDRFLGPEWLAKQDQPGTWEQVAEIPDAELWQAHQLRKAVLIGNITERIRERWHKDQVGTGSVVALGALIDPDVLTIGFARRFTGYKRPDLILSDVERLKRILTDSWRPVQIIFAGKAHPADLNGKRLIQQVFRLAEDSSCAGRIAFLENYDQQLGEMLVQGVDLWLNNPIPPLEASGTSGMKASVNGIPTLSILDGWWIEGYNGENGWAFGDEEHDGDRTQTDASALYDLLEKKIVPLFYRRSEDGIPHDYIQVMKEAIATVAPRFSTRRMVKEYAAQAYVPALGLTRRPD